MMFGSREAFEYAECGACGSLWLVTVPADLGRHYPEDYYSFSGGGAAAPQGALGRFKRAVRTAQMRHVLGNGNLLGPMAHLVRGGRPTFRSGPLEAVRSWVADVAGRPGALILDVGCGAGALVWDLYEAGYTSSRGIDPYLRADAVAPEGPPVHRCTIGEAVARSEGFDLVMLHHVLEHLPDPEAALRTLRGGLRTGGVLLVRVPLAQSAAWERYGEHWAQLDPPRHLFVPSVPGLLALAARCGLALRRMTYDSTSFQFWASEQYVRDIPLSAPTSYSVDREASLFPEARVREWEAEAQRLNAAGRGDQGAFFFERTEGDDG